MDFETLQWTNFHFSTIRRRNFFFQNMFVNMLLKLFNVFGFHVDGLEELIMGLEYYFKE